MPICRSARWSSLIIAGCRLQKPSERGSARGEAPRGIPLAHPAPASPALGEREKIFLGKAQSASRSQTLAWKTFQTVSQYATYEIRQATQNRNNCTRELHDRQI